MLLEKFKEVVNKFKKKLLIEKTETIIKNLIYKVVILLKNIFEIILLLILNNKVENIKIDEYPNAVFIVLALLDMIELIKKIKDIIKIILFINILFCDLYLKFVNVRKNKENENKIILKLSFKIT